MVQYKYDAWGNHAVLYWNKVNDKEQYNDVDEAAFDENYAKNEALELIIFFGGGSQELLAGLVRSEASEQRLFA